MEVKPTNGYQSGIVYHVKSSKEAATLERYINNLKGDILINNMPELGDKAGIVILGGRDIENDGVALMPYRCFMSKVNVDAPEGSFKLRKGAHRVVKFQGIDYCFINEPIFSDWPKKR